MPRIRTIKPEFPQSESMGRVSRDARLTFIQMWTLADDSGRLRGNSRMLASFLFPYDDDAPSLIEGWLEELSEQKCIIRYVADDGANYIQICNWSNHQKIDKPSESRIPAPTSESIRERSRIVAKRREDYPLDQGPGTKDQGPGTKDQGPLICSEISAKSTEPKVPPDQCEFPIFPCAGEPYTWEATSAQLESWRRAYPAIDVDDQHRRAHAWVMSNLGNRKTAKGYAKFLNGWFSRQQDRQGSRGSPAMATKTFAQMRVDGTRQAIEDFVNG